MSGESYSWGTWNASSKGAMKKGTIFLALGRDKPFCILQVMPSKQLEKQFIQVTCVQKAYNQKTCIGRDHIWLNVWCRNHAAKFRNDCNRLNTMSQENRHDIEEWEVNNCWIFKHKPQENPLGSTGKHWWRFYHFFYFFSTLPSLLTSIAACGAQV